MESMKEKKRVGLIEVHSAAFRDECLPHPRDVLSTVNATLPLEAVRRNKELLDIIRVSHTHLFIFISKICYFFGRAAESGSGFRGHPVVVEHVWRGASTLESGLVLFSSFCLFWHNCSPTGNFAGCTEKS